MVTKDYSKSRMRENRTYGSVRGGQSNLIPSTRLTDALRLRVVVAPCRAQYKCCLRQCPLWCRKAPKGESGQRPLITPLRFLLMNLKASSRNQPGAGSWKLTAVVSDFGGSLPADCYLLPFVSYTPRTEILRLRLRMTMRREGKHVTLTINCGARRHHNPRPEGPSNLRTLRTLGPAGPVNLPF